MASIKYVRPERLPLKGHPQLNEKWVLQRIAEDPSILGLGNIILLDKERAQPQAGRLDLLCEDDESTNRFEIEVQLGKTDESHIIRTIEYWDIERKRYPKYQHTAVLVAEDVTGRFLNVLSLFNRAIPIVVIQMHAIRLGDQITLVFVKVLDETQWGPIDEEEEIRQTTNRSYWEHRGSKSTVAMVDDLLGILKQWDNELELKYNKFYIGLSRNGEADNFVVFRPKKHWLRVEIRLEPSSDIKSKIEESGLDVMEYDTRWGRHRIRIGKNDIEQHRAVLTELLHTAYQVANE